MIEKAKGLLQRYREQLSYLFFGGLTTLLNIVLGMVFLWMNLPTTVNTVLSNFLCILFAYFTNRKWVFCSHTKGQAACKEFVSFVTCRLGTLVLDVAVMWLGVDIIGGLLISPEYENLWFLGVKVFTQVLIVVGNYIFSKLIIFKNKE